MNVFSRDEGAVSLTIMQFIYDTATIKPSADQNCCYRTSRRRMGGKRGYLKKAPVQSVKLDYKKTPDAMPYARL